MLVITPLLVIAACNSNGDSGGATPNYGSPPQAVVGICGAADSTTDSLMEMQSALVPLKEVAMQQALQHTRDDVDDLASEARQTGQTDQVATLAQDLSGVQNMLTQPSMSDPQATPLQDQVGRVKADLDAIKSTAGCA